MSIPALRLYAGPAALAQVRERGLRAIDIGLVAGAAGGPKGLVLGPLDRYVFGCWLPNVRADAPAVHLAGASIGAWRLAAAAMPDPVAALQRLQHDYIHQTYALHPGRSLPTATQVSDGFSAALASFFDGQVSALLTHPRYRLHIVTSRGRNVLGREGRLLSRLSTPLGYVAAWASNAASRRTLGAWLERVVFSAGNEPLPVDLSDLRHRRVPLTVANFQPALLASCSIPFALKAVRDIPGAPPGVYWDGGITDYHLHWNYRSMASLLPERRSPALVLYPHFQRAVVPGWLDKGLKHRHLATPLLDNVVVAAPDPAWVAQLPNGKLPDRTDFHRYRHDWPGRMHVWAQVAAASERLADDFDAAVHAGSAVRIDPL